jgi:hypothetical protein
MVDVPAPRERPATDEQVPAHVAVLTLGALVLLDAAASATRLSDHVPGWLSGTVGLFWGMAVLGVALSIGESASTTWRLTTVPVLSAFALFVGLRVPDRGGWSGALHELVPIGGLLVLAMVLVPPMRAGMRAWDRRHPTPTAAQRLGLSGEAAADSRVPLRWSTGSRTVVLDDVGDRRLEVVKLLRDLGKELDFGELVLAVPRGDEGPIAPLTVATGLSDADASALLTALQGCRASGRVL